MCTTWYSPSVARSPQPDSADAPVNDSKERLLRATIDYVADHGLTDRSLRQIAAAIGTSHRMLVYHFGSKDGLLIEVVRAVESDQRSALEALAADASLDPTTQAGRLAK